MNKKLDKYLTELEKNYSVRKGKDIIIEPKIRTGIYPLDYVLDGGFSQYSGGHMCEFYGGESSGKTTFALKVIARYQELGKICVFINAESSYDPKWATINGVNNDEILVIKPDTLEESGECLLELIPKVDLVVIDSITALVPKAELDRDLTEKTMASQASVNSPMCRKINRIRGQYKTTVIFINQMREKVGVMYGNPETTSGGRALKHLYDSRVRFKTGKPIDIGSGDKKERIGMEINLFGKKNKKGKAYRKGVIDFYITGEIDNKTCLFFSAIKYGIIGLSGKTYTYKKKKAVGKDNAIEMLTNADYKAIEEEIWKRQK